MSEKDDPWRETGRDVFGVILDRVDVDFFIGILDADDGECDEWYPKDVDAAIDSWCSPESSGGL